jgi:hypothetical protein
MQSKELYCPIHKVPLVLREAKRGKYIGQKFWACPTWTRTHCNYIENFKEEDLNSIEVLKIPPKISFIKSIWNYLTETYHKTPERTVSWVSSPLGPSRSRTIYGTSYSTNRIKETLKFLLKCSIILTIIVLSNFRTSGFVIAGIVSIMFWGDYLLMALAFIVLMTFGFFMKAGSFIKRKLEK